MFRNHGILTQGPGVARGKKNLKKDFFGPTATHECPRKNSAE